VSTGKFSTNVSRPIDLTCEHGCSTDEKCDTNNCCVNGECLYGSGGTIVNTSEVFRTTTAMVIAIASRMQTVAPMVAV
jgi:hypothetical protein